MITGISIGLLLIAVLIGRTVGRGAAADQSMGRACLTVVLVAAGLLGLIGAAIAALI